MICMLFKFCLLFNLIDFSCLSGCDEMKNVISQKYKLLKAHARAENQIITRKEISTLEECFEFAKTKKALAVNFRRISRSKSAQKNDIRHLNCQVLGCPETSSLDLLIEDNKYSYYSAYSRNLKLGNETTVCLPNIGLFVRMRNSMNFTNAQSACKNMRGKLADVMSEERSEAMAQFIFDKTPVYVGLSNQGEERRWKNEFGQKLECTDFRAWAHGDPASRGCTALVRYRVHKTMHTMWRVFPCSMSFPFICEILPRVLNNQNNNKTRHKNITKSQNN